MKTIFLVLLLSFQVAKAQTVSATTNSVVNPPTESETLTVQANDKIEIRTPAETEIPLNLETPKKAVASEGIVGKVIYSIAILILLAGGIFYFLRRYALPKNSQVQAQIKVLSQHHFGPKRSLALVRVAGESILIGITDQNINLVKSLSLLDEDVPEDMPKSFSSTLKEQSTDDNQTTTSEEDFAISGIKDIVQRRLKSMRNFQ